MSFIKSLPVTSDMVSLWIPSGTGRAIDVIRENHGQCTGTHPNVLVGSSLIDTSLGWHFDGTDDYINLGNDGSLNVADATLGAWVYLTDATESAFFSKIGSTDYGYIFGTNSADKLTAAVGNGSSFEASVASAALSEDCWHFVAVTFEQSGTADTVVKIYEDCSLVGQATETNWVSHGSYDNQLGRWHDASLMDGYIALPFVTNSTWSSAQVNNFCLATKGLFAPRG